MEKWYFSFGVGTPMKNYCVEIVGTYDEARNKMVESFGRNWCCQYSEEEWKTYEENWGTLERIYPV